MWVLLVALVSLCSHVSCSVDSVVAMGATLRMAPLVLEEVLEHGPLFDELEEEAWWAGVDIDDTALRPAHPTADDADDACGWNACGAEMRPWAAPPPPPPVPPALTEIVRQIQQQLDGGGGASNQEACLLCQWAAFNLTVDVAPSAEPSSENTWIPMLVVVALVSAMLGAILMITAIKCRRFKVLPRGGSCPTLPHGYMVGEGKDGVQTTELSDETLPKTLQQRHHPAPSTLATLSTLSTLSRPRLSTPVIDGGHGDVEHHHHHQFKPVAPSSGDRRNYNSSGAWGARLWRKMVTSRRKTNEVIMTEEDDDIYRPYGGVDGDAMSAVYAELNGSIVGGTAGSVLGHRGQPHSVQSPYQLNTYAEIGEGHQLQRCRPHSKGAMAAPFHLRRLLSDGTYENAGYALERGVILVEHDAASVGCASTPSSAYYSDLSGSNSGGSHQHPWPAAASAASSASQRHKRNNSGSLSLSHHYCQTWQMGHHHDARDARDARDLMPVALEVIPDNQQILPGVAEENGVVCCVRNNGVASVAAHYHTHHAHFSRGGASASLDTSKRPLPPLPSRQLQRPQRRYAYAVDHAATLPASAAPSDAINCVPSEYV